MQEPREHCLRRHPTGDDDEELCQGEDPLPPRPCVWAQGPAALVKEELQLMQKKRRAYLNETAAR